MSKQMTKTVWNWSANLETRPCLIIHHCPRLTIEFILNYLTLRPHHNLGSNKNQIEKSGKRWMTPQVQLWDDFHGITKIPVMLQEPKANSRKPYDEHQSPTYRMSLEDRDKEQGSKKVQQGSMRQSACLFNLKKIHLSKKKYTKYTTTPTNDLEASRT
ncbi:hypothetical protein GOBAR_AA25672 [Gossypium barbadense]|uniref:Uncharacterized protein n=1 Tax=Gossypium barbadense TaxID=3634 RepID=A0A2P5WV82_GOSBA|nr:hypothetical protein GOBAR_AA25672 [Gossypium barbadense]